MANNPKPLVQMTKEEVLQGIIDRAVDTPEPDTRVSFYGKDYGWTSKQDQVKYPCLMRTATHVEKLILLTSEQIDYFVEIGFAVGTRKKLADLYEAEAKAKGETRSTTKAASFFGDFRQQLAVAAKVGSGERKVADPVKRLAQVNKDVDRLTLEQKKELLRKLQEEIR